MFLNLINDGSILIKESFGASHPLSHGSLCSNKGLGCNREIENNGHDGKKFLSSFVYSYRILISLTLQITFKLWSLNSKDLE